MSDMTTIADGAGRIAAMLRGGAARAAHALPAENYVGYEATAFDDVAGLVATARTAVDDLRAQVVPLDVDGSFDRVLGEATNRLEQHAAKVTEASAAPADDYGHDLLSEGIRLRGTADVFDAVRAAALIRQDPTRLAPLVDAAEAARRVLAKAPDRRDLAGADRMAAAIGHTDDATTLLHAARTAAPLRELVPELSRVDASSLMAAAERHIREAQRLGAPALRTQENETLTNNALALQSAGGFGSLLFGAKVTAPNELDPLLAGLKRMHGSFESAGRHGSIGDMPKGMSKLDRSKLRAADEAVGAWASLPRPETGADGRLVDPLLARTQLADLLDHAATATAGSFGIGRAAGQGGWGKEAERTWTANLARSRDLLAEASTIVDRSIDAGWQALDPSQLRTAERLRNELQVTSLRIFPSGGSSPNRDMWDAPKFAHDLRKLATSLRGGDATAAQAAADGSWNTAVEASVRMMRSQAKTLGFDVTAVYHKPDAVVARFRRVAQLVDGAATAHASSRSPAQVSAMREAAASARAAAADFANQNPLFSTVQNAGQQRSRLLASVIAEASTAIPTPGAATARAAAQRIAQISDRWATMPPAADDAAARTQLARRVTTDATKLLDSASALLGTTSGAPAAVRATRLDLVRLAASKTSNLLDIATASGAEALEDRDIARLLQASNDLRSLADVADTPTTALLARAREAVSSLQAVTDETTSPAAAVRAATIDRATTAVAAARAAGTGTAQSITDVGRTDAAISELVGDAARRSAASPRWDVASQAREQALADLQLGWRQQARALDAAAVDHDPGALAAVDTAFAARVRERGLRFLSGDAWNETAAVDGSTSLETATALASDSSRSPVTAADADSALAELATAREQLEAGRNTMALSGSVASWAKMDEGEVGISTAATTWNQAIRRVSPALDGDVVELLGRGPASLRDEASRAVLNRARGTRSEHLWPYFGNLGTTNADLTLSEGVIAELARQMHAGESAPTAI